jgi:hypothetical protein
LDGSSPFNDPAQRVEPHDGQKRSLCERTLRRTVLYVNKFLLQLRDRMIARFRAGKGRRLMLPRLNPGGANFDKKMPPFLYPFPSKGEGGVGVIFILLCARAGYGG